MQRLSYDPKNPVYSIFDQDFSLEVFTMENVFGLDPERTEVKIEGDKAPGDRPGTDLGRGGRRRATAGRCSWWKRPKTAFASRWRRRTRKSFDRSRLILPGRRGEAVTSDYAQDMPIFEGGMVYEYPSLARLYAEHAPGRAEKTAVSIPISSPRTSG